MQRPEYRSGRIDRAVKTSTVCDESRYLIVRNVPALGCVEELVKLFGLYGEVEEYRMLDEEDCEPFTDVYWIKYAKYNNSRFAKRKLDNHKFLGNLLDVSYASNEETLTDTKNKLEERRRAVLTKIQLNLRSGCKSPAREHSQLKDPLLQLPSESQQHPPFPLHLLPLNSRQQTSPLTTNLQEPQRSASVVHQEISEVCPVAPTTGQEFHGASVEGSLEQGGPSKRSVVEDTVSLPIKKRQDTRRRI